MTRPIEFLAAMIELFGEFFAGPQAGEDDGDVFEWLAAGKGDHVESEIEDLDRFTHVEHHDLSTLAECTGFQHEL